MFSRSFRERTGQGQIVLSAPRTFVVELPVANRHSAIENRQFLRGLSSVGRAPQWHCGGQGFESPRLQNFGEPAEFAGCKRKSLLKYVLHRNHVDQIPWLLLLYSLPAHRNTQRVAVWRRFKKIGALQLTTSTYLLPDQPAHYEHFQWLTKLIRDSGGEATLVRVREIEGMPNEKLVGLFNEARDREYAAVSKVLHSLSRERKPRSESGDELSRLTRQFRDLRAIDFFNSQRGQEIEMQLQKLEHNRAARGETVKIRPADYR